jgi:molybdopterin converting factor small subunit
MKVRVIFSGRGYDAAASLPDRVTLEEGSSLDIALEWITAQMPGDRPLPSSCLVAVSGVHVGTLAAHRSPLLRDGDEIVLIAPVAGG